MDLLFISMFFLLKGFLNSEKNPEAVRKMAKNISSKKLDQLIKQKLGELSEAVREEEKYLAYPVGEGTRAVFHDFFEMAKAFDTSRLKEIELEILFARRFPNKYPQEALKHLEKEGNHLQYLLNCWEERKYPSK